jgi:transcriptional regulator GlxA family with amidase domain
MQSSEWSVSASQHEAVLAAALMMRESLDQEVPVGELAKDIFFSRYHFTRIFSAVTGLPPGRFLSELRILVAEDLLVNTDLTFTEITYRVGYTSVGTFSSRFKAVTGKSPSDYRKTVTPLDSALRGGRARRGDTRLVLRTLAHAGSLFPASSGGQGSGKAG